MADQKFVQFLRELADWYEGHPEVPPPYSLERDNIDVYLFGHENPKEVLRSIGSFDKKVNGEHFVASKEVAGKMLTFTFYRDKVCTPKVVGKKHIEKQIIPEQYVPSRVIEAHDADIIEWECNPVLAPDQADQDSADYPEGVPYPTEDEEIKVPSHVETDAKGIAF